MLAMLICPFYPMILFVVLFYVFSGYMFYVSWVSLKKGKLVYLPLEFLGRWIDRHSGVKLKEPKYSGKFSLRSVDWGPTQRGIYAIVGGIGCFLGATFLLVFFVLPYH